MQKYLKKILTILILVALTTISGCDNSDSHEPKTHISQLNQSGGNAPVESIIKNTLNLNITWTRLSTGHYKGVLNRELDLSRTTIFNSNIGTSGIFCYFTSNNEIALDSTCGANAFCDDFTNLNLQITVY